MSSGLCVWRAMRRALPFVAPCCLSQAQAKVDADTGENDFELEGSDDPGWALWVQVGEEVRRCPHVRASGDLEPTAPISWDDPAEFHVPDYAAQPAVLQMLLVRGMARGTCWGRQHRPWPPLTSNPTKTTRTPQHSAVTRRDTHITRTLQPPFSLSSHGQWAHVLVTFDGDKGSSCLDMAAPAQRPPQYMQIPEREYGSVNCVRRGGGRGAQHTGV